MDPTPKRYEDLTKQEAAAALKEFLAERDPALAGLRQRLGADGQEHMLDGTVESLVQVWRWAKSRLLTQQPGQETPSGGSTPTWLRHFLGTEPTLSPESLDLVDGLVSYFCRVVERGAPNAQWQVGYHRIKSYRWQNHPVLAADRGEHQLAAMVAGIARGQASGGVPSDDGKLARAATAIIDLLNGGGEEEAADDEPVVEVEELDDDPHRGREFEVALREDVAHEHSRTVDRLVKKLATEEGVTRAFREDREVLLVTAPTWDAGRLRDWVLHYFEDHIRD
ncbi:hypothetical protein [Pseudarthrobacter sulfonivorans]|uniref:hypothetical protein n=1 Tax=Pseudarthrobacter sulfonivorans TaxID=121292 RepID=UPI00286222C2|nr:hypothetical protein [Pseudarthrobacter sulfonivorans]MDR6415603.1 hypothetical protein [Pseudarthrobacter sulfonivorans]